MRKVILIAALALVAFAQRADSQHRTSFVFSDSECAACGYKRFAPGIELATVQRLNSRFTFEGGANLRRARKVDGNGFKFGGEAGLRIGIRTGSGSDRVATDGSANVYLLAGVRAAQQQTSFYKKTAVWPYAGVGVETEDYTLSARYLLPDLTSPNKGQAVEGSAERRWILGLRQSGAPFGVLTKGAVGVQHFRCNQGVDRLLDTCTMAYGSAGFGVYF